MNLTPGELYFIRETDLHSRLQTDYVKVGLVKEVGDRTSDDRASEHQTGNPRKLHVAKVVKSHAISEVENIMHKLYAPWRVYGEWFLFQPAELKSAIATAEELSKEISSNLKNFQLADKYKLEISTEKVIKPTSLVKEAYENYQRADIKVKACSEMVKGVKEVFRVALEAGEDVAPMAAWQVSGPREGFDLDKFAEKNAELYEKYCIEEEAFSARFTMIKDKDSKISLSGIDKKLEAFLQEIEKLIANKKKTRTSREELFEKYLVLLGHRARADLDKDVAQAVIQVACKTAAEIEGVCKWKREMKSKVSFDMDSFAEAHPKLVKKYTTISQSEPSLIVNTKREYALNTA
jgi:hypothetical protein